MVSPPGCSSCQKRGAASGGRHEGGGAALWPRPAPSRCCSVSRKAGGGSGCGSRWGEGMVLSESPGGTECSAGRRGVRAATWLSLQPFLGGVW